MQTHNHSIPYTLPSTESQPPFAAGAVVCLLAIVAAVALVARVVVPALGVS